MSERKCPRCKVLMHSRNETEFGASFCMHCNGIYIEAPAERLNATLVSQAAIRLAQVLDEQPTRVVDERALAPCPTCAQNMTRMTRYDVEIDTCAAHGTWFDAHELCALARATQEQGASDFSEHIDPMSSGLELAREPRRERPKRPELRRAPDKGANEAIADLQRREAVQRRNERWQRRRWHHGHDTFVGDFIIEALFSLFR